MSIADNLRPWKPGDPLSADHLNQATNILHKYGNLIAGDSNIVIAEGPCGTTISLGQNIYAVKNIFQGKIVQSGLSTYSGCSGAISDFIDHRYFVEATMPNQQDCQIDLSSAKIGVQALTRRYILFRICKSIYLRLTFYFQAK